MAPIRTSTVVSTSVRRLRRTLDDAESALVGRHVLALCSGGADSVALVALLAQLPRGAAPASIRVLFLDHGLRDDVEEEARCATLVAERCGFPLERRALELHVDSNVEAAARDARYRAASDSASAHGCDVVATGHTAADQLEQALLSLVGVTGRTGEVDAMPVARPLTDGITLVRPLLGLTRADIEACCADLELEWGIDPTNHADDFVRAAVRHRVVPTLLDVHPTAGSALARAGARARERSVATDALAAALLDAWSAADRIDVRRLATIEGAARRALIARWLGRAGLGRGLTDRLVRSVDQLALLPGRAACARVDLPRGACVRRDGYDLTLQSAPRHGGSQP